MLPQHPGLCALHADHELVLKTAAPDPHPQALTPRSSPLWITGGRRLPRYLRISSSEVAMRVACACMNTEHTLACLSSARISSRECMPALAPPCRYCDLHPLAICLESLILGRLLQILNPETPCVEKAHISHLPPIAVSLQRMPAAAWYCPCAAHVPHMYCPRTAHELRMYC